MVAVCSYCGKRDVSGGRGFHSFPLKNPEQCEEWLKNMSMNSSVNFIPTKNTRLCSDHFGDNCFTKNTNIKRLSPGSVPTKFGRYFLQCVCCKNVKRPRCGISFRKFPLENPELLRKWIKNIKQENFYPNEKSFICDAHFEKTAFYSGSMGNSYLKANTCPTIFSTNFEDTSIEIKDDPYGYYNLEIEETNHITCNKIDKGENSKISETAALLSKNNKRLCTGKLQEAKHFEPNEHQFGNYSNQFEGSSQCQREDIGETAFETSTNHLFGNTNSYSEVVIKNEDENLVTMEQNISQPLHSEGAEKGTKSPETSFILQPETLSTQRRYHLLRHDHTYEPSFRSLKKRYQVSKEKLKVFRAKLKVQQQHIGRLKKRAADLTEILQQLILPEQFKHLMKEAKEID